MKSLKIVATIAIIALVLYYLIASFRYYTHLFTDFRFESFGFFRSLIQTFLTVLKDLLLLVLCFIFLLSPSPLMKDKAYRLLRFTVVMSVVLYLPFTIYWYFSYQQVWYSYITLAVNYFAAIVLLIAPPDKPIERIDLSNYEMVAFTAGGHRFVHILLDRLFLLPFWLSIWDTLTFSSYNSDLSIILLEIYVVFSYLLYCFLSEAIFRQTFGKILTGSVVVSNGVRLSTGRILLRTIARLIPFDAISFLFGANWHDKTTSTAVVYNNTWEKVFEQGEA